MFSSSRRHPFTLLLLVLDSVVIGIALYLAFVARSRVLTLVTGIWTGQPALFPNYQLLLLGSLPILLISLHFCGAYEYSRMQSKLETLATVLKAAGLASVLIFAFAFSLRDQTFSRSTVLIFLSFAATGFVATRATALKSEALLRRSRRIDPTNAVIVGTGADAKDLAQRLESRPYLGYRILGHIAVPGEKDPDPDLPALGVIGELPRLVDEMVIDDVLFGIGLDEAVKHEKTIWKLEEVGTTVHLRGDAIGVLLSHTFVSEFDGLPILTLKSTPADPLALAVKRTIDLAASFVALVVLSPLILVTALLVKLTSKGPVLYRQERVGLNGRRFTILKFRSMFDGAEKKLKELRLENEMSGPAFKMKNDPRVTPIGKWTRKFSIDELPQLWNVFVGDMSLVGPRPPLPHEVEDYQRWQRRRLSMKPGITCLWQIRGRNNVTDFDEWMKLDMAYIDTWSLVQDAKILLKTIPVVLFARGAR